MAYYVSSFRKGYIAREANQYQLVVDGEVVGTYDSVEELAKANKDGEQAGEAEPAEEEAKAPAVAKKPSNKKSK